MYSPQLPWEVIEQTINHCRGHPKMLWSLSITCHQLLPRTCLMMFAHVWFENRDHVFVFVDFLQKNPFLKLAIHLIAIWPPNLAPIPLLRILPSLSKIEFISNDQEANLGLAVHIHQSTLACFQLCRSHIRTLCLSHLDFEMLISFAWLLLAFVNVTHLTCSGIQIIEMSNGECSTLLEAIKWWLFKQVQLEALTVGLPLPVVSAFAKYELWTSLPLQVNYKSLIAGQLATPMGQLLLDSSLVSSMISSLTLREVEDGMPC